MKTRSKTNSTNILIPKFLEEEKKSEEPILYDIIIDFDEASNAWLANKVRQPNATYKYRCLGKTKTNKHCNKIPLKYTNYCSCH